MGQIRKIGGQFYIEFYARGLMYSQLAGSNEKEAIRLLEEVEAKIAQGEAMTIVRDIELELFFEEFLSYAKGRFSVKSIQRFSQTWKHWVIFLNSNYSYIKRISQITPSVVEFYKASLVKSVKPKIVNLTLLLLREILEHGIRIGFLNDNPTLHTSLLKLPLTEVKVSQRLAMAKDLLRNNICLEKIYSILKLTDVAKIMYWSNFIPIQREDVYN
ncbi:MAG: hypothetical protein HQL15_01980 [Candidatus Omnitrophica bacterium]|nr:hypothetical protein [Candidatus Omnitrophota bacterium]